MATNSLSKSKRSSKPKRSPSPEATFMHSDYLFLEDFNHTLPKSDSYFMLPAQEGKYRLPKEEMIRRANMTTPRMSHIGPGFMSGWGNVNIQIRPSYMPDGFGNWYYTLNPKSAPMVSRKTKKPKRFKSYSVNDLILKYKLEQHFQQLWQAQEAQQTQQLQHTQHTQQAGTAESVKGQKEHSAPNWGGDED